LPSGSFETSTLDFRCNYQIYSYNSSQTSKKIKTIWFSPLSTMSSNVLDEGDANLYKIQEDIIAKFEGGEIIENTLIEELWGARGE
jgi:hypothetical protein